MKLFIAVALAFLILVLKWYLKYFRYYKCFKKFKGPRPLPIVGNAFKIGTSSDTFTRLTKTHKMYGEVFSFWIGFRPRLVLRDPEMIKFVLGSNTILDKASDYRFLSRWLGNGLLTCPGATWHKQRKLLTPAFHFQILQQFVGIFNAQSAILVENLGKEVNRGPCDIFNYLSLCALDIICEAAMGTSVKAQENVNSKYVECVKGMCTNFRVRTYSPIKAIDALYKYTEDYVKETKMLDVLHGYTNFVIRSRKEQLSNEEKAKREDLGGRLAMLDLLLRCQNVEGTLSDEYIRQEVDTFMFEGHDTTSAGIGFTLYSLSRHPDIQDKVVKELRTIFGGDKYLPPTYNHLQEMKYLEMVIKESLRLYPSVPFFSRTLSEDYDFDGVTLPKGLTLGIFVLGVHMRPDLFPNPEKFDPERFSPENSARRSTYSYIPFSAGPRNCIGQRFAMLELKAIISTVLRHFKLLPVEGHKLKIGMEVILRPLNGLPVELAPRNF